MTSAEYKITKDFGGKTLQNVFVKREDAVSTDSFDIKAALLSAIRRRCSSLAQNLMGAHCTGQKV